jgi:hypothetical protein
MTRLMRRRALSRGLLAGPAVFVTAAAVMAGGALWLPAGRAQIDHIVLPVVLFPAIWALLFFYASLDRQLLRAWLLVGALLAVHLGAIAWHLHGAGVLA